MSSLLIILFAIDVFQIDAQKKSGQPAGNAKPKQQPPPVKNNKICRFLVL